MSTLLVLRVLVDDEPTSHFGLDLIRRSGVKSGTLYPILDRLERDGWIVGAWEEIDEAAEGRRKRRYYRLTALGARLARTELDAAIAGLTPSSVAWAPS